MENPRAYFIGLAEMVSTRGNCKGAKVGSIIVRENRIISTGYNGTPSGVKNCTDGGCMRCNDRNKYPSGAGYDYCICIHGEINAILQAAKFGTSVDNGDLYSTLQPCLLCLKEILQVGIINVYFKDFQSEHLTEQHNSIIQKFNYYGVWRDA